MTIRIGVSACLLGQKCNFNGQDLLNPFIESLSRLKGIEFVRFCPEDVVFGTPRPNLRIVGGDGFDVLDGRAKVVNERGLDVTNEQIAGARRFLETLNSSGVEHAILMEGSPSCGTHVILKEENWPKGGFKRGSGVTSALLRRNGITVLSGFDQQRIRSFLGTLGLDIGATGDLKDFRDLPKFGSLFES